MSAFTLQRVDSIAGDILDVMAVGAKSTVMASLYLLAAPYKATKFLTKKKPKKMARDKHGKFVSQKPHQAFGYFDFSYFKTGQAKEVLEFEPRTILEHVETIGMGKLSSAGVKHTPTVVIYAMRLNGVLPSTVLNGKKLKDFESDLTSLLNLKNGRVATITKPSCDWGNNSYLLEMVVPKKEHEKVALEEMLTSKAFWDFKGDLVMPIGKSADGYLFADLAKLPHLLVAGTTGSGKSVGVNAMLLGLMHRLSPKELKFLIIDPKAVEFTLYENSPYLLSGIVDDMDRAVEALQSVVILMEARYNAFKNNKVKDITAFNKKANEPMERVVVVIDELADLMDTHRAAVECLIGRLAQKARASGIHLILATQRPSVNVITGDIKANIDTRISYRLKTATDSVTILGEGGAESLLGMGDGYISIGGLDKVRFKAPYISDDRIEGII